MSSTEEVPNTGMNNEKTPQNEDKNEDSGFCYRMAVILLGKLKKSHFSP